jgi:hypothetical protein
MKKYIKPVMDIHRISLAKVMMTTLSNGSGEGPGNGGNTGAGGVTVADAKRRRGRGIFDDDFEQESLIW